MQRINIQYEEKIAIKLKEVIYDVLQNNII